MEDFELTFEVTVRGECEDGNPSPDARDIQHAVEANLNRRFPGIDVAALKL